MNVALTHLPSTDSFLRNSNTPIIRSARPFIVISDNFELPQRPLNPSGTNMTGGIFNNVSVELKQIEVHKTGCNGRLCNQTYILNDSVISNTCACFQMDKSSKILMAFTVTMSPQDGDVFETVFVNKAFVIDFILSGELSEKANASDFHPFHVEDRLFECATSVFNYINQNGGFRVYLWAKRGIVQDANVDQPLKGLPYDGESTMVESGHLNRHVVEIVPMAPERINLDELEQRKFDIRTDFAEPVDVDVPDDTSNVDGAASASGLDDEAASASGLERSNSNGSNVDKALL